MQVSANVSTRDVSVSSSIGGSSVPGLTTRNFNSTVEMREGQTLAVAGLIQNNLGSQSNRLPFFGDIPILNHLTGIDSTQAGEQELIILITPELVSPLEKKQIPPVPGSDLFEPSDLEFFLLGRVESRRSRDYRSPVMNDPHRMMQYHECEKTYIFGAVGHTNDPNYPFHPYKQYDTDYTARPPILNQRMPYFPNPNRNNNNGPVPPAPQPLQLHSRPISAPRRGNFLLRSGGL